MKKNWPKILTGSYQTAKIWHQTIGLNVYVKNPSKGVCIVPSNSSFSQALMATTGDKPLRAERLIFSSNLHLSKCLVEPLVPKWFQKVLIHDFGQNSFTQSQSLDSLPLSETVHIN